MSAATDVYTNSDDLDAIADELLAADPPEQVESPPLVGPSPDEAQDKLDAALIAASSNLQGADGKIGSIHASARDLQPTTERWIDRAECSEAPPEDQDALTESRSQAEAAQVITEYCEGCPVADQCLQEGRATRGWGVYGGIALIDGRKAAQYRPGDRAARQIMAMSRGAAKVAADWLAAYLADNGPSQRTGVMAAAAAAGHGKTRLDKAANILNVTRSKKGHTVEWSLPGAGRATEQASQGAALWLIDHLASHGPTPRQDVLNAAPYRRAVTLAGAALLDLDTVTDRWGLA